MFSSFSFNFVMSFVIRDERNNRDVLRSVETFNFDTTTRGSLIFILSRCRHLPFENYNNKECRHLYTDSLSTITGWYREVDAECRFISWSASRRASSSISLGSSSSLFVSEKFPVMSFVGRFPCRTEKLNAKVLSDIQFHDAAGKRDLRTPSRRDLDTVDNYNVYNLCLYRSA